MSFTPNCMAIAIGSLPHKDVSKALDIVRQYLPEAPIWPQLPKIGLNETMKAQYCEGMPCIKIDYKNNKAYFDTSSEGCINEVSERLGLAMDGKFEEFKISKEFASGFYGLRESLAKKLPHSVKIIKGHVTGPISFGLSMHDEKGRAILYNESFKDAIIKILAMKGKWQTSEFLKINKNITPMILFDEPYLTQIGTPFVSIQRDEAIEMLNTCLDEIEGIKGIHVCGNTDWSLVAATHTDVINFDAYAYPESLSLYPEDVNSFLKRGGMIAWGITPSTEEIAKEDRLSIFNRLENAVDTLCKAGFDKEFILKRSFVSPSCGTGSLTEELAEKVFKVNYEVSVLAREKYF